MSDGSRPLAKRERQIVDALHRLGEAGVAEVVEALGEEATYDSVRVTLSILEKKGHVKHRKEGRRYVYRPGERRQRARSKALQHLLATFFDGSVSSAVSTLLDSKAAELSEEELDRLAEHIRQERERRKG